VLQPWLHQLQATSQLLDAMKATKHHLCCHHHRTSTTGLSNKASASKQMAVRQHKPANCMFGAGCATQIPGEEDLFYAVAQHPTQTVLLERWQICSPAVYPT